VNGISFFGVVRSYLPLIAVPIEGSLKIQGGKLEWQNLKVHNTYLNVTTKGLLENAPSVISGKQISTVGNPLFGLLFSSSELGELSFVLATTPAEENPLPLNLRENVVTRSQVDQGSFIVVQMRVKNRLDLADADEADQQLKVGDFLVQLPNELIKRHKLDTTNPPELSQVHNILDSNGRLLPDSNRWIVAIQDLPLIAGLQAYSRLAKRYLTSLQTITDGRPISGLPVIEDRPWCETTIAATAHPAESDVEFLRKMFFTFDFQDDLPLGVPLWPGFRNRGASQFRAAIPITKLADNSIFAYRVWLPGFARHDFQPSKVDSLKNVLTLDCVIDTLHGLHSDSSATPDQSAQTRRSWISAVSGFVLALRRVYPKNANQDLQWVRMGALDLAFTQVLEPLPEKCFGNAAVAPAEFDRNAQYDRERTDDGQQSIVTLGLRAPRGGWAPQLPTAILDLTLRSDRVSPGGQDGLPNEPIVSTDSGFIRNILPQDSSSEAIRKRFVREPAIVIPTRQLSPVRMRVQIRESTGPAQSQKLSLQLFAWSSRQGASLPQRVPLLVIDRQPFTVAMVMAPPLVGLGGADANLEIGNWSKDGFEGASWELGGSTDGFSLLFPPQAIGESTEKRSGSDVIEAEPAQFRLSPIARFEINASYFRQNFTEAVWNLRRILGYVGQRAPGAAIRQLQFELLYGMGCTLRIDGLRLAELASRLGEIPGAPPGKLGNPIPVVPTLPQQDEVYVQWLYRWSRQFATYASRLGVFEVWTEAQPGSPTFKSGVSYELRPPQPIMVDPTEPAAESRPMRLAGGALWGFDFKAQYEPFARDFNGISADETRRSTAGELSRPVFSALGGWGFQKAVFQNGLTTIYSDTAMGRTFFYSVERRGRVAGYWNFAKHVVIYERTVGTALQFRPNNGITYQDHLAGRAVLRKVREFVELLQPVRSYPDLGGTEVTRGCVQAIEFKTKIIPIDSTLGRDVRDGDGNLVGYVLPLWKPDADPAIYPKPQVALRLAGATKTSESQSCEIEDPHKLYFYSQATAGPESELNTDSWPAVRGVDYPDVTWPATSPPSVPSGSLEQPSADESAIHPGYAEFTYSIRAAKSSDVIAGRSDSRTMGALLKNVSMVRADPLVGIPNAEMATASNGRSQLSKSRQSLAELESLLRQPLGNPGVVKQFKEAAKAVKASIDEAKKHLDSTFQGPQADLLKLKDTWTIDRTKNSLVNWQKEAVQLLDDKADSDSATIKLFDQLNSLPSDLGAAKDRAMTLVGSWTDIVKLALPTIDTGVSRFQAGLGRLSDLPAALDSQIHSQLNSALGELETSLEYALGDYPPSPEQSKVIRDSLESLERNLVSYVERSVQSAVDCLEGIGDLGLTIAIRKTPAEFARQLRDKRRVVLSLLDRPLDEIFDEIYDLWTVVGDLKSTANTAITGLRQNYDDVQEKLKSLGKLKLDGKELASVIGLKSVTDAIETAIRSVMDPAKIADIAKGVKAEINSFKATVDLLTDPVTNLPGFEAATKDIQVTAKLLKAVVLDDLPNSAKKLSDEIIKLLKDPIQDIDDVHRQLKEAVDESLASIEGGINRLAEPLMRRFPSGLAQTAGTTMRLVRAFGESPYVAGMEFTRKQVGYFYDPLKALKGVPIDMSPAVAMVNRVGGELKGLGISLPTGQLFDQVLPPTDELMRNLDFGKMLPDFAGLKLDKLLPDLKAPAGLSDKVKITHNVDKQTGRGWVNADVAIPVKGPTTLFDGGVFAVSIRDIKFTAKIRIEAGLSGAPKNTQSGALAATWDLTIGGKPLISFLDTTLAFDETGDTKFTLDPSKIRMDGVLSMLSDVMKSVSDPKSGFVVQLKKENGLPIGVEAILNLPLPNLTFGVCSLTNLRFGASIELVAAPEFAIGLRVHVAEKTTPFTLTVFILGGGGWFDARGRYLPLSNRLTTSVSIGLSAGASLAISFGPVNGCVFAFFFVEGEMRSDSGSGDSQLIIRIGLLLGGDVDVCGLITVCIRLLLELEYTGETGSLVGRGSLSIRVKVCFFLTISVSRSVEKRFAGKSNKRAVAGPSQVKVNQACNDHLSSTV
jgi:hypothetical protein